MTFDSANDLQNYKGLKFVRKEISNYKGAIVFDPENYRG